MDLKLVWNAETLSADLAIEDGDLAAGDELESAVVHSLFTDRLAAPDDRLPDEFSPDPIPDRRGWVGDDFEGGGFSGSKLWLRVREKWTEATRATVEQDCREALQWLLDDGVANRIDVAAYREIVGRIDVLIVVHRIDGRVYERRFDGVWKQLAA